MPTVFMVITAIVLIAIIAYVTKKASEVAIKSSNDQLLSVVKEVISGQKNEIHLDLEGKKSAISDMVSEIRRELRESQQKLIQSDQERVSSFSALKTELESYKQVTGELKISTDKLKGILSNNQMRGTFGEQIADNLLKMAGFVIGADYTKNTVQETERTRPDFTLYLPDKTKINVDAKFPYASLVKSIEANDEGERKRHFLAFRQDVKNKIKQVCTRDYINPEEKTVDFVILFIPNEMIFSYIYDTMNDVWEEAMGKKVVLAGPFSFTAILRMVKQAYTNFSYQENIQSIIGLVQKFDSEYQKYGEEVDKLGERIAAAGKQFDTVSNTRNRQLTTIVDKIKSQHIIEKTDEERKLLDETPR